MRSVSSKKRATKPNQFMLNMIAQRSSSQNMQIGVSVTTTNRNSPPIYEIQNLNLDLQKPKHKSQLGKQKSLQSAQLSTKNSSIVNQCTKVSSPDRLSMRSVQTTMSDANDTKQSIAKADEQPANNKYKQQLFGQIGHIDFEIQKMMSEQITSKE